jgi:hypothetical protein
VIAATQAGKNFSKVDGFGYLPSNIPVDATLYESK